jgi:transcriptional regulator GlxA family with amidase domain
MGTDLIALKMSEVIFAQALRTFIESQAAASVGLSGFADLHIVRALTAFRKQPAAAWTVEGLAREAGLSRTGFAQRFAQKWGSRRCSI